jgi:sugar phosphate isomerase/epimerase
MNNKICFYTSPFPGIKSYYDMIDVSAEFGLSYLEAFCMFDFETPDLEAAKKIRAYADGKNVKFSCFSVYINLVGSDSKEMIEKLKGYADIAAILGSPYLHHTIVCECVEPNKVIPYREEFFEKGIAAVREIYDYAAKLGVKAIYEEQGYLFNGIDGIGRLIDAVDRDIGIVADFGNIAQSGDDLLEFIEKYHDRIVHAHVKDITLTDEPICEYSLKTLTGQFMTEAIISKGDVKIKEAIELLNKHGYNGCYGIEYGARDDNSPVIAESLAYVESCY